MVQNLGWAMGYNTIVLPLAAGALVSFGVVLPARAGAVLVRVGPASPARARRG